MDGVLAGGETVKNSELKPLKGALASRKGKGMSFANIRKAATEDARSAAGSDRAARTPARRATQT